MQPLEQADQRRSARQLVLAKRAFPSSGLHPVPGTFRDTEQRSALGITATPSVDKSQNGFDCRARQAVTIITGREGLNASRCFGLL